MRYDATADTVLARCNFAITVMPWYIVRLERERADNLAGTAHAATARAGFGDTPLSGVPVRFRIVDGPGVGRTSDTGGCARDLRCATDGGGTVCWTYTGVGLGVDSIVACFLDPDRVEHCAGALATWFGFADRFEANETVDRAAVLDEWTHDTHCAADVRRLIPGDADCSGVFDDGPAPRGAVES